MTTANGDYPEFLLTRGEAGRLPLPDASVDLVFGSPPYVDARLYLENGKDLGISRNCRDWVEWMLRVTAECLRVSRGPVVWVAAGKTEDRNYWPACEGLIWAWWEQGGHAYRPCYWHRVGIPGSGSDQWFRSDIEHVMCFKRPGKLPWADNTTMGKKAQWPTGGPMSYRDTNGVRRNSLTVTTGYSSKGDALTQYVDRQVCEIANPGNVVKVTVGGGHLGSDLAHENEAPFPEALAEHFIRSLCPPGGIVLDPFSGSGTSVSTALKHGRRGIGLDLRQSQCDLGKRRVADSLRPVSKLDAPKQKASANGQNLLNWNDETEAS